MPDPVEPPDPRHWHLFPRSSIAAALAVALSGPGCGSRALADDGDAGDDDTGALDTTETSVDTALIDGECIDDSDCGGAYYYCAGSVCHYDPPCGVLGRFPDGTPNPKCSPPYECYDDEDCGDGFICDLYGCVPGDIDPPMLSPQCDDAMALPNTQIPLPELAQVIDLAFTGQTLAVTGSAANAPDATRVVLVDTGTFQREVVDLPTDFDPQDVALGDLDGDDTPDLAVLDPSAGLLFVRDGAQATIATFGVTGMTRVGIAELTADPGMELFGVQDEQVAYWVESQPSMLGTRQVIAGLTSVLDVRASDIGDDATAELLVTGGGAAQVYSMTSASSSVLDETLVPSDGQRRLAGIADAGAGAPRLLDAESFQDTSYVSRHQPFPGGFAVLPSPWPVPFSGTTRDVALLRLLQSDRVDAVVAVDATVYAWLNVLEDGDCWHILGASSSGPISAFHVGDADADGVEGLAYTDGSSVWIGGD